VLVWRICARRWAGRAFDGEGARLYGGRWNPPGIPMVYASSTLSLAALELFVHLDPDTLPDGMAAIAAEVSDEVERLAVDLSELPQDWRSFPAPEPLRNLGARWTKEGRTAVLSVPSALIPAERNWLLNPRHPDFSKIRIYEAEPFEFDPRMWKRAP
jgi:RES domain-containing protein